MQLGRTKQVVVGVGAALVATLLAGGAAAHAQGQATLVLGASTIDAGGNVSVSGEMWQMSGEVTLTVGVPGTQNTVTSTTTTASPNAQIAATLSGPTAAGDYQVCASGNDVQGAYTYVCQPLNVRGPVQTTTTVNNNPGGSGTTTPNTTANTTGETAPGSVVDSAVPVTTNSPNTTVDTVPMEPDGETVVEEPGTPSTTSGSRGLQLGLVVGVVVLTGIGVVGLLSSKVGDRPRPRGAIGVGLAGAVLATAVAIGTNPDTVHLPPLGLVRVQSTFTVASGKGPVTHSVACPSGLQPISGGFVTSWSSLYIDVTKLVSWVDSYRDGDSLAFVKSTSFTSSGTEYISADYWDTARADRTLYVSDSMIDRHQRSSRSVLTNTGSLTEWDYIKQIPELVPAFRDLYYEVADLYKDGASVRVRQSAPDGISWTVTAELPDMSLMPDVDVAVTAICAPIASDSSQPGVLGVRTVRIDASPINSIATCNDDELLSGVGWVGRFEAPMTFTLKGNRSMASRPLDSGVLQYMAICVKADHLDITMASASNSMIAGRDGLATAACPTGYLVIGGVYSTTNSNSIANEAALLGSYPIGAKSWSVRERGITFYWPKSTSSTVYPLQILRLAGIPPVYETLEQFDTTTITATALCARRVP